MLLMGKSTISMAIFNSYVKLPEAIHASSSWKCRRKVWKQQRCRQTVVRVSRTPRNSSSTRCRVSVLSGHSEWVRNPATQRLGSSLGNGFWPLHLEGTHKKIPFRCTPFFGSVKGNSLFLRDRKIWKELKFFEDIWKVLVIWNRTIWVSVWRSSVTIHNDP